MKERSKHSTIGNTSLKVHSTLECIEEYKDISQKNNLINIIKNERNLLIEKEKKISKSLKNYERILTEDEIAFKNCKIKDTNNYKIQEQVILELFLKLKHILELMVKNKNTKLKKNATIDEGKKLLDDLHLMIKDIMNIKHYAQFMHNDIGLSNIFV